MNTENVLATITTAATTNTYTTLSIPALSNMVATSHMGLFSDSLVVQLLKSQVTIIPGQRTCSQGWSHMSSSCVSNAGLSTILPHSLK